MISVQAWPFDAGLVVKRIDSGWALTRLILIMHEPQGTGKWEKDANEDDVGTDGADEVDDAEDAHEDEEEG